MRSVCNAGFVFLALLALACARPAGGAEDRSAGKPIVIALQPFGIPKTLFAGSRPLTCFHTHAAGTKMFWLDADHIFVSFTTNPPCTIKAKEEPINMRAMVFDRSGAKIASQDWPVQSDIGVFPGPDHSIVVRKGRRLEFLNLHLESTETGELDETPKGLWVTPRRRSIPLLSHDGRTFEFYEANPLKLAATIALDQTQEANSVQHWLPGDERIAGSRCLDQSDYSCTKILVLTPDANFLAPDGAPWSYEETGKPVSLQPVGFLNYQSLVIEREEKGFFKDPQVLIVHPQGGKTALPKLGSFFPYKIAGVDSEGSRFGMECYPEGMCANCVAMKRFVVAEPDAKKFLFDLTGSPEYSEAELSPDGKWMAVLDKSALTLYPLP